jgi:hypothetical protein
MSIRRHLLAGGTILILATALSAQDSVVRNGDFQQADADGNPSGWQCTLNENTVYMNQGGNRWLKVANGGTAMQKISLMPEWQWLYIGARMKARNVVLGENSWNDVRLNCYYTAPGSDKNHYTSMPILKADSDWIEVGAVSTIPKDAGVDTLVIQPTILCGGEAGYDDITVIPLANEAEMKAKLGQIMANQLPRLVNGTFAAGSFKELTANGLPKDWNINAPMAAKIEPLGAVNALVLTKATGGQNLNAVAKLKLEPGCKSVRIRARAAGSGIVPGTENYQIAKIQVLFMDYANNKITEGWPNLAAIPQGDVDWQDYQVEIPVPDRDDCYLAIDIMLWAASGTYKVSDIRVEPIM